MLLALADGVYLVWSLALAFGFVGRIVHTVNGSDRLGRLWQAAARVHQEAWLFAAPAMLIRISDHVDSIPWYLVIDLCGAWVWWTTRDWPDDENPWKRRGKRAKDAVTERAGRLVVVPA